MLHQPTCANNPPRLWTTYVKLIKVREFSRPSGLRAATTRAAYVTLRFTADVFPRFSSISNSIC